MKLNKFLALLVLGAGLTVSFGLVEAGEEFLGYALSFISGIIGAAIWIGE